MSNGFAGGHDGFRSFALARPLKDGFFDTIELDPSGVIRIRGWLTGSVEKSLIPVIHLDGEKIPFLQQYRVSRPDVEQAGIPNLPFQPGFVMEYLVTESFSLRQFQCVSVTVDKILNCRFDGPFHFINPHYRNLIDSREVYHREQIYGSGPPNPAAHPDILALARKLQGPLLDFGCGSGALISELQARGVEAYGLELESDAILRTIRPELRALVTLYDGDFPVPLASGKFRTVFCSEVLEHIPEYEAAISEVARLAGERAVFTVPDASAIPLGFRYGVAPWHLLEGTHVNFFNQTSLQRALERHFAKITFGRVCLCKFNDSPFYVSLVADCYK